MAVVVVDRWPFVEVQLKLFHNYQYLVCPSFVSTRFRSYNKKKKCLISCHSDKLSVTYSLNKLLRVRVMECVSYNCSIC